VNPLANGVSKSAVLAALLACFVAAVVLWRPYSPQTATNGPSSTIGKSGEMKSPGGSASISTPILSFE
jgi:hypothetical protein